MTLKIAFGYRMGAGKDTAVDYLIQKYGGTKISFASHLYKILHFAQNLCGFPLEKDREFLQWVGTEWGRKKEKNIWVRLTVEEAEQIKGNIFNSDVRFPNEFQTMKDNGWVCIKINRNQDLIDANRAGSGMTTHSSETALDSIPDHEWDFVIDNNGTLEEFYTKLDQIVFNLN